ncbi:MAG: hypothetical protein LBT83_02670 [Tannerella sp.]|nr:hypothetical protein [Tannerella sp.]
MKQHLFITCIAVMLSGHFVTAQEQKDDAQKFDKQAFQAKRNAYITAEIGLTADEAAEFIPLDNELKQKQFEAGQECRKLIRISRSQETLSDAACLKLIDCSIETRIKEAQLEKEYYEKFKHILSPVKLYKYQEADFKFMKEFMRGSNHHMHRNDRPSPNKNK